ncbi:MAG: dihydrofolate reductase family protein [Gaiellales bacterium]
MGELIVSTQVTLDGVMDPIEWFNRHGEHAWHQAAGRASFAQLRAADALLLGRRTYEGLAGVWPDLTDEVGFADHINAKPKFVASRSPLESLSWNAQHLEGDLAPAVVALKQRSDGHLLSYGCGELAHQLVTDGLVDELRFWVNPVAWGAGTRPFHGSGPIPLELAGTTTFDTGVVLLSYRPTLRA